MNRVYMGRRDPPPLPPMCVLTSWLIYLDEAKAQMCLVKRQLRVNQDFKGNLDRSQTVETSERCGSACCTYASHVPHEVLVGLLGVPLLPLFASLHLGQQRLPVRLVGFDDVFQLLHEKQLQHALICVQVCQLKQLPLQDVVIPDVKRKMLIVNYQYPLEFLPTVGIQVRCFDGLPFITGFPNI